MNVGNTEDIREFRKDLFELQKENIKGIRSHLYQMLLLSGAIAAFLMPVYASEKLSQVQEVLIPLSITSLLLAVVIGVLHLSQVLRDENKWLSDMQLAIYNGNREAYERAIKRSDLSMEKSKRAGFYSLLVDLLFALGCLFIIAAFVLSQYGY